MHIDVCRQAGVRVPAISYLVLDVLGPRSCSAVSRNHVLWLRCAVLCDEAVGAYARPRFSTLYCISVAYIGPSAYRVLSLLSWQVHVCSPAAV